MIKKLSLFFLSLLMISCSNQSEPDKVATDTTSAVSNSSSVNTSDESSDKDNRKDALADFVAIDTAVSFSESVFDYGESYHLNGCAFDFGCDCCASKIVFYNDSSFYFIDDCMSDLGITQGKFSISDNKLELVSDGICINKEYDPSKEYNPNIDEFTLHDTIIKPYSISLDLMSCDHKIALIHKTDSGSFVGLATTESVKDHIKELEKTGIIDRFKKAKTIKTRP